MFTVGMVYFPLPIFLGLGSQRKGNLVNILVNTVLKSTTQLKTSKTTGTTVTL